MALFTVKTSKKVETNIRLEESTAKMLDRYAHFHKGPADDVVNEALEYIFKHDKDFQQHLQQNPDARSCGFGARSRRLQALRKRAKSAATAALGSTQALLHRTFSISGCTVTTAK